MHFNLQPFLENDLVRLRPLGQADFEHLYTIASDPLIWEQHQNKDRHTLENFTEFFKDSMNSKGALVIIDAKTDIVIGSSRFKIIDKSNKIIEIGWSFLSRNCWGGHYNRSFKKLMVNHALQYFEHVIFYVNPKNYRSQRAMEKLGAKKMADLEKSWVLAEAIGVTYAFNSKLED